MAQNQRETFTNSIGMTFVLVPPGEFFMGAPDSDPDADHDESPQHSVRLTRPFFLAIHPVTIDQFRGFVEATGHITDADVQPKGGWGFSTEASDLPFTQAPEFNWRHSGFEAAGDHPVVNVSHNDALAFCKWLARTESKGYRLPTEAQWEYACRAGTTSRYYAGDLEAVLESIANIADVSLERVSRQISWCQPWDDGYPFTSPVGSFQPNTLGLFDMLGNVWEWCADRYAGDAYSRGPMTDPTGPASGSMYVLRGGSWLNIPEIARSTTRNGSDADYCDTFSGFRLACTAD